MVGPTSTLGSLNRCGTGGGGSDTEGPGAIDLSNEGGRAGRTGGRGGGGSWMGSCFFFLPMAEATRELSLSLLEAEESLGFAEPVTAVFSDKLVLERFERKPGASLDFERDHHDLLWVVGGASDIGRRREGEGA